MTLARRIDKIKIQNSCGIVYWLHGNFTTGIFAFQEKIFGAERRFLFGNFMKARNIRVEIEVNGKNITDEISTYVKSVSYTDVLDGEADTAEILLQDANRIWCEDWFPQRGDTVKITLIRQNWNGEEVEILPLDFWEIDECENDYSYGGGNECKVKLNSIPNNTGLRSIDESHSWEKVKLSKIAGDIAAEAGLTLFYDTKEDPEIARAEQSELSNLAFLQKLCKDKGLALKASDRKLIIFDEEKYEGQTPIVTLHYGTDAIKHFGGKATISKIYKSCKVEYKHGKKSEEISAEYTDPSKKDGMTLKINQKVETKAEAEKLAKKKLREKNKEEIKISLTLVGNFVYLSGNVIEFAGHGFYDGNYIIEKATHKVGNGYEVSVDLRKCLSGY